MMFSGAAGAACWALTVSVPFIESENPVSVRISGDRERGERARGRNDV